MGMSASQVRLLSLTSRLHDIELDAQSIEAQKIALATQKDELYQAYCDALDATTIQVAYYDDSQYYVTASYNTLCTYNSECLTQYALIDANSGKVIVDEETAEMYENYSDKYSFAWAMLGFEGQFDWDDAIDYGKIVGIGAAVNASSDSLIEGTYCGDDLFMTEVEWKAYSAYITENEDSTLEELYNALFEVCENDGSTKEKKEALAEFREELYDKCYDDIYTYMCNSKNSDDLTEYDPNYDEDADLYDEFKYYCNLFDEIEAHGGCTTIDEKYQSGDTGEDWLYNMVKAGRVLIEKYDDDEWTSTTIATSTSSSNLREVSDDTELAKAEAEYEYELDKINAKDTKYDNELSKLETERTSITTEMDSVETVIGDNVERTYSIFT